MKKTLLSIALLAAVGGTAHAEYSADYVAQQLSNQQWQLSNIESHYNVDIDALAEPIPEEAYSDNIELDDIDEATMAEIEKELANIDIEEQAYLPDVIQFSYDGNLLFQNNEAFGNWFFTPDTQTLTITEKLDDVLLSQDYQLITLDDDQLVLKETIDIGSEKYTFKH